MIPITSNEASEITSNLDADWGSKLGLGGCACGSRVYGMACPGVRSLHQLVINCPSAKAWRGSLAFQLLRGHTVSNELQQSNQIVVSKRGTQRRRRHRGRKEERTERSNRILIKSEKIIDFLTISKHGAAATGEQIWCCTVLWFSSPIVIVHFRWPVVLAVVSN